jgi:CBS domain containing-hemolysin-like protein
MNLPPSSLVLLMGLSLLLASLFSGMEAGMLALSRLRVRRLVRLNNPNAVRLQGFLDRPEDFLWTLLVGNTAANFLAVTLMMLALQRLWETQQFLFWLLFLAGGLLFYIVCELLPKMLFQMFPNRLCLLLARPFGWIHLLLRPAVWLLRGLSALLRLWIGGRAFTGHLFFNRDELRQVMHESGQGLTSEERVMIDRVLDLQNVPIRAVASRIDEAMIITTTTPVADVIALFRKRQVGRLPVWERVDGRRRVAGIVNVNELLYLPVGERLRPAAHYLKPALFLDESVRLEAALRQMQRSGQRVAVVLDREKNECGVVGLRDILQIIFTEAKG